jgi:uncharacterized protein YndB with AHSA1/START domain
MSRTTTHIDATPDRVFDLLDDARTYEFWVVGCKDIRAVDDDWPANGSAFHHKVGMGRSPSRTPRRSSSASARAPQAPRTARPAGVAHVDFALTPSGSGTTITITEAPVEGPPAKLHNPVQDKLIHGRNVETLRRLKWLAERG